MHQNTIYRQAEQILMEYQSLHHMHNTPERTTILQQITKNKGSFTPADVVNWVKPYFISTATVYNTINLFEKAQIIVCLPRQNEGRKMEYELMIGDQSLMSVICAKCGRITRVKNKSADTAIWAKNYSNFILRRYSLFLYGECKYCSRLNLLNAKV